MARTSKEYWKWPRGKTTHPLKEGSWRKRHFVSIKRWEYSPTQVGGACAWSVVPLDHDEEMGLMRCLHGTMEVWLKVQRTVNRAELTAFLYLLKGTIGPTTAHLDNKGIIGVVDGRNAVRRHKGARC